MAQNYYEILGVTPKATPEEIETAFKKRARDVHPDTVAPGNPYLRQVAAEAFKDLSEAKAILLNPTEREKYDAKLEYARTAEKGAAGAASSSQGAGNSRTGAAARAPRQAQKPAARTAKAHPPLRIVWKPARASLVSFAFVVMGLAAIFFIGWLILTESAPPLWITLLTAGLGALSVRHGLKPSANARLRTGIVPALIGGFAVAFVYFTIWFPSASSVVTPTSPGEGAADAAAMHPGNETKKTSAARGNGPGATVVAVDESGADVPGFVTRVWKSVRDGSNYRTRAGRSLLFLEPVEGREKASGEITHCEFHRSADNNKQSWKGVCAERDPQDRSTHYSSAEIKTLSDTQLEGSTENIPAFLMVAIPEAQINGAPAARTTEAEPDLSALSDLEKQSLATACASEKLLQGPMQYTQCVKTQLEALRKAPKTPDLSGLSERDHDAVELVCSSAKLIEGPASYNRCLTRQLDLLKKQQQRRR
ncbi:MAG TPA: J domain-containing protein [Candidatus Eisenbacteria bacterium]|jgi:hypothetical protein|nr:J domain-containing protein [Candidatus Eisenbacteria bacterium]